MRVVILGGTGLIGRALAHELVADHQLVILSRRPERAGGLPEGIRVEPWDGADAAALGRRIVGADAVVQLAGAGIADGRWTESRKRVLVESRVRSSHAVAEAMASIGSPPALLLQGSAVGYYGFHADEELAEEAAAGTDFLARVCRQWEAASAAAEALGVHRLVLRTGVVLSRDGGALPKMVLPFRFFAGGPTGTGRQFVPWIHIADEVGAIRFLLENRPAPGPYNLTAPAPVSSREFATAVGRRLRRPSFAAAPGFALRLLLGEQADIVLEGQRAIPRRLLLAGYRFRFPRLDEALADLLD